MLTRPDALPELGDDVTIAQVQENQDIQVQSAFRPSQTVRTLIAILVFAGIVLGLSLAESADGRVGGKPDLLMTALRKLQAESERWAFTQIQVMRDAGGRITGERVVRVDPSRRFEQRRLLISVDGRDPTAEERRTFQKEREKDRLRREREAWQGRTLEDKMDLQAAATAKETDGVVVFRVPLVSSRENPYPADKFQLLITVDSQKQEITEVSVRLREHIRAALVARIDRGELTARFRSVDPVYPAPLTHLQVGGSGTILFVRVGVSRDERRIDFERVTPWDERFSVEFGELEFLGF